MLCEPANSKYKTKQKTSFKQEWWWHTMNVWILIYAKAKKQPTAQDKKWKYLFDNKSKEKNLGTSTCAYACGDVAKSQHNTLHFGGPATSPNIQIKYSLLNLSCRSSFSWHAYYVPNTYDDYRTPNTHPAARKSKTTYMFCARRPLMWVCIKIVQAEKNETPWNSFGVISKRMCGTQSSGELSKASQLLCVGVGANSTCLTGTYGNRQTQEYEFERNVHRYV